MQIRQLFASPVFADEEKTRQARLLQVILWSSLLLSWVTCILLMFVLPQNKPRWIWAMLGLLFTVLVSLSFNRSGRTRMASVLFLVMTWVYVTMLASTAGGVFAPVTLAYVISVLIAGLLLGPKAGVILGIISSLTGLALVGLEMTGHLPIKQVVFTPLSMWVTEFLYLGLIAVLQFLASRSIQDSLGVAQRELAERQRAETALRRSHEELEERVRERTAELQTVNKELEAFTYSVSHDLKSPLRAVDGFAQLLIDDYAKVMPEDGRQMLAEIKTGSQRMSDLIEGLLRLSRVDREPMVPRRVNLKALVSGIAGELKKDQKDRDIEMRVGELPDCNGDPALLRQVFVNLISNAIKFTGKREKAVIEVGCKREEGKAVCFVRDNGVGFDMKYADKLFGVFQRLHRASEFSGTGVGLSIVQRIIHRHGGRIWAESKVNEGTTFYFTLPEYAGAEAVDGMGGAGSL